MKNFSCHIFALFCLVVFTNFSLPVENHQMPLPTNAEFLTCSLPAPGTFYANRVSTNSVDLSWSPVSGAIAYKITVYELDGGTPVYLTESEAGGTSRTQSGVPSGVGYRFTVAAICSGNSTSDFIITNDINP